MEKIHRLVAGLLSVILLFTAGCSKPIELPEKPPADVATVPTETTKSTFEDTSLVSLRSAMVGTPQVFAVAYFGYHETGLPIDPFEVMQENAPQLCADLPFLLDIPPERIIGESGELFCIVPLDENAIVAVSKGMWFDDIKQCMYEESLYFSESGEPILVFCNSAGFEPDVQVFISGSSGEVFWYPMIDDNLCAIPVRNDNGDMLFYDFSPYREMLVNRYRSMGDGWTVPTADILRGSTWCWDGFLKDGREVSYQLSFHGDTLSVQWNDGIDEESHVYRDAHWELTNEEDFAILSIDFREMAGVLRYNLRYHEEFGILYLGMDVMQEEMPIGWEPLYRYMTLPIVPEPVEMLGKWELAWTEVEGDRNEAEPGSCSIEIGISASSGFLMSYTSREFPHNNFENEHLSYDEREMYYGCGNDMWVGDLDYVGPWDTTYTVTLTVDDILIKQNYFLLDGAPTVSYEYFCRAEE